MLKPGSRDRTDAETLAARVIGLQALPPTEPEDALHGRWPPYPQPTTS